MEKQIEKRNLEILPSPQDAPTAGPSFQTKFASLSLHMTDRIRLMQFSQSELLAIRCVIEKHWHFGIQDERRYSSSHEFKMHGNPWSPSPSSDASIPTRLLMRGILAFLFSTGWILTASTDISRKAAVNKDTLIFRQQATPPPPSIWIALSFNHADRLCLIGAPPDLIVGFQGLLKGMKLLQEEFWNERKSNAYEFKIYGKPWRPQGEETMICRLLILKMIELLEKFGWSLYASIDQTNGQSGKYGWSETDSWYCVKAMDWVPGRAVFHR